MSAMRRFRSLLSFLFAVLLILSAVVFPAAEQNRIAAEESGGASFAPAPIGGKTATVKSDHSSDSSDGGPFSIAAEEATEEVTAEPDTVPTERRPAAPEAVIPVSEDDLSDASAIIPAEAVRAIPVMGGVNMSGAEEQVAAVAVPADEEPSSAMKKHPPRNELVLPTIDTLYPLEFEKDYSGMLSSVDERHIYHFTVAQRGYLQYTVRHAKMTNFMGWEVTLYQEYYLNGVSGEVGYRQLNLLQTTAPATTEASPTVGVMPGRYRIVIKTTGGIKAETYTLNVGFTADHTHEIECNDTKAAYTELYADIPMIGSASCYSDRQDDDWYLLRLKNTGSVRLTFTHGTADNVSVAWRVALYSEDGQELYAENSGMNKETVDSGEIGVSSGIYFVAVLGRVRCEHEYTLTVTSTADDHFECENNDTMDTANLLPAGGTVKGSVGAKAGRLDRDFFRFDMTARGNFSMSFTHDAPSPEEAKKDDDKKGWNIRLLSSSGEVMYSMVSTWQTASVSMPPMGLEQGTYYVEINSEDLYRNPLTYTLTVGNTQASSFETEPNNTPAQATPIVNGVPITGTIIDAVDPDDDYYVFQVPASSRVTVLLKHQATDGDKDIFWFSVCNENGEKAPVYFGRSPIVGKDGKNVFFVESPARQPTVSGLYELPAGTYYIKVTSGRFLSDMDYMIQFYFS